VCRLVVSDAAAEEGPRSLYLLNRWFDAVISLTGGRARVSLAGWLVMAFS